MKLSFDSMTLIKGQLEGLENDDQRIAILKKVVRLLKKEGVTDDEILKAFRGAFAFEQQSNTQMLDNNARYLELLKSILNQSKK